MRPLLLPFSPRYILLTIAFAGTAAFATAAWRAPENLPYFLLPLAFFSAFAILGIRDLTQRRHAILRDYPIAAHLRFILENIRPEMRQYFFELDKEGMPFPRDKRAIVYQRAKHELDKRPFGTQYDVCRNEYEWMHHSMAPKPPAKEPFRILIGGRDCRHLYSASVFNISAMSFGSISANAIATRAPSSAALRTIRAKAVSARTIASTVATSSGRSAPATSAAATKMDLGRRLDAGSLVKTAAMTKSAAPCNETAIIDTEVVQKPPQGGGMWKELWSVLACGKVYELNLLFTPADDGGTDIAVTSD